MTDIRKYIKKATALVMTVASVFSGINTYSLKADTGVGTLTDTSLAGATAQIAMYLAKSDIVFLPSDDDMDILLAGISDGLPKVEYHVTYAPERPMLSAVSGNTVSGDSVSANAVSGNSTEEDTGKQPQEIPEYYGYKKLGVANVDNFLNMREKADINSKLVGKMPAGAGCEILDKDGDWYYVRSGKVTGYVSGEFLATGDSANAIAKKYASVIATVTTVTLKVREEPNTDCRVMTLVPEGEELHVVEDQGEWIKIDLDDDEFYVSSDYVTLSLQLPHASTIKELTKDSGYSSVRVQMVQFALQYVGNKYVWGGESLTNGVDCSGFTMKVYAQFGIKLPHSSRSQAAMGTKINASQLQPGDLVFYGSHGYIGHVAIYIGNGQIVHASNARDGIKISNLNYRSALKYCRYFQ